MRRLGIIGGTGREGGAIATRYAKVGWLVYVGSRDLKRAQLAVNRMKSSLKDFKGDLIGCSNQEAAEYGEAVFLTVPYIGLKQVLDQVSTWLNGKLVVDVVVPNVMRTNYLIGEELLEVYRQHFGVGKIPSVTEEIYMYLNSVHKIKPRVVAALKTVSFKLIADLSTPFRQTILIWGFNSEDVHQLRSLLKEGFPEAELLEVPQIYWSCIEGVCEFIRHMSIQGVRIDALSFTYGG
ncbi:MAG: hypothetical protein DRJ97_00375 [Thermoprotei archaeon]|nr:MAG: hypothetical protein DRJ97_00375 [Thermoprotei archaeon]